MKNVYLVWLIRGLSFAILILIMYATVNIIQSTWFRFYGSRSMSDREKREFYVEKKYDIKWSSCTMVALLLGSILSQLLGLYRQVWWELLCVFLFWFLLWGNYRTLNIEKERLKKKNDFGI